MRCRQAKLISRSSTARHGGSSASTAVLAEVSRFEFNDKRSPPTEEEAENDPLGPLGLACFSRAIFPFYFSFFLILFFFFHSTTRPSLSAFLAKLSRYGQSTVKERTARTRNTQGEGETA